MNTTIVLKDQRYLNHITRCGHPESSERLAAIYKKLNDKDIKGKFKEVCPREATKQDVSLNHSIEYIKTIEETAGRSIRNLDPDTTTSEGSWDAAIFAVGAVITGIDMILDGDALNGFALVRPPGHHAESSRSMGFCLFNNIAVGAHYLLKKYGLKRILVVDWDIHHGNGTQNSFYNMPEVLYFSTHQFPYYPGSGDFNEVGVKRGKGYTVNVPLPGGQGDEDFIDIFKSVLQPIVEEYRPQFILVSAGYDIYHLDPLGTMEVTSRGFYLMTKFLRNLAEKQCDGKILLSLEGGYHVDGLAESVKDTIIALSDDGKLEDFVEKSNVSRATADIIEKTKKIHADFWPVLSKSFKNV